MKDNWEHAAENSAKCYEVGISALRERLEASKVVINDCTLYCEDAEFVAPTLIGVDAIVTDPPYGINYKARTKADQKKREYKTAYDAEGIIGDDAPFDPLPWLKYPNAIFWGSNNFCQSLPKGRWLIWDKRGSGFHGCNNFSDCEIAWCSKLGPDRIYLQIWNGIVRQGEPAGQGESRLHPTQKPIALMKWCIQHLPADVETILDPFMGSGTTGVAAVKLGKSFIGIERERKYFDIAVKRITEAYKQPDLFVAPPENKLEQMSLLESDR